MCNCTVSSGFALLQHCRAPFRLETDVLNGCCRVTSTGEVDGVPVDRSRSARGRPRSTIRRRARETNARQHAPHQRGCGPDRPVRPPADGWRRGRRSADSRFVGIAATGRAVGQSHDLVLQFLRASFCLGQSDERVLESSAARRTDCRYEARTSASALRALSTSASTLPKSNSLQRRAPVGFGPGRAT